MRIDAVVAEFKDLDVTELSLWIDQGWVRPVDDSHGAASRDWQFEEIDRARVRLVYDLRRSCNVGPELIPMVLSLLDQIYDLRRSLSTVSQAINRQPEDIRTRIIKALQPS